MSNRLDYYFRQRVTEAELDMGFAELEQADQNLAADLGFTGVLANAVVSQHAPVPDLTVDVSGPGSILDQLGHRIFFSALQNVSVAQDDNGVSTAVSTAGKEKIVSVLVKFDRSLSDPRVDGNSLTVFFRRDESFKFVVVQGAEAAAGGAIPPPLQPDAILLADITRTFNQSQILMTNISTGRRQDAIVLTGSPRSLRRGRTIEGLADLLGFINAHANGTGNRHLAAAIDYAGGGAWADGTTNSAVSVEAQLDKVISDLAAASGAPKIGAAATSSSPNSLTAGSVKSQLDSLLGFVNGHINDSSGAHAAAAVSYVGGGNWADGTANPATTVEAQLDKLITDLAGSAGADKVGATVSSAWADGATLPSTRVKTSLDRIVSDLAATSGAPKVGAAATSGTPNALTAGSVKSQLEALLGFINGHISNAAGAHAASAVSYAGGSAWKDGTTNPATTVEAQLDKVITDLIADAAAARLGAGARTNWLGGRTNPAGVSIFAAIDKIITDLNAQTVGDDGAERIGAAASGNLPAGSVRSQLNSLDANLVRTNVSNTFSAAQILNGAAGDTNAALRTTSTPTTRKLLWEISLGTSYNARAGEQRDRSAARACCQLWLDPRGLCLWPRGFRLPAQGRPGSSLEAEASAKGARCRLRQRQCRRRRTRACTGARRMNVDVTDVGLKVLEILSPVLLAALTWVSAKVAQLISAKVKNEYLRGVLGRLDDAVLAAVREVQQVTVDAIKAASADGKLTPEERARVKQVAIDAVKSHLGAKGLAELARILGLEDGAIDKLLSTRVEAAVHDLKVARAKVNGVSGTIGEQLPFPA
jgi:hypothetical protein